MYQMNYKIFEVQEVSTSKDNLQIFEVLDNNTYFRQMVKFKFLLKN